MQKKRRGFVHYNVIPGWGYAIEVWADLRPEPAAKESPARLIDTQAFPHPRYRDEDEEGLTRHAIHDGVMLMREHGLTGPSPFETDDQCQSVPDDVWAQYQKTERFDPTSQRSAP